MSRLLAVDTPWPNPPTRPISTILDHLMNQPTFAHHKALPLGQAMLVLSLISCTLA